MYNLPLKEGHVFNTIITQVKTIEFVNRQSNQLEILL